MKRPTGVTILAWLAIVGGVIEVFAAIAAVVALMAALALGGAAAAAGAFGAGAGLAFASMVALLLTVWLGVLGIVGIVFGVGALGLRPWAWTLGVIWCYVAAVSDILSLFSSRGGSLVSGLIGVLFAFAILYYLFTDEVRAAFGKSDKAAPAFLTPAFLWVNRMLAGNNTGGPQTPPPGNYPPPPTSGGGGGIPQAPAHYDAPEGEPPAPPAQ